MRLRVSRNPPRSKEPRTAFASMRSPLAQRRWERSIVSPDPPRRKRRFLAAVPLKRGASAAESANVVVFVASGEAAYINGQVIRINGGKTAS
jgi:NAD(P)-dependent dehydrogenase (short-subunit alcohol dehydrogenase family)